MNGGFQMDEKASCGRHDKHHRRCAGCAIAELDRLMVSAEIAQAWQQRADAELPGGWKAYAWRWETDMDPRWGLEGKVGGVTVNLVGDDADEALAVAKAVSR